MSAAFWLLGFPALYFLLGAAVMVALDDKHENLLKWFNECPSRMLADVLFVLWPALASLVIFLRWRDARSGR